MTRPLSTGEADRASARARAVLKSGDRVGIRRQDQSFTTLVFDAFVADTGPYGLSRSGLNLSVLDVERVNAQPRSFRDPLPNHQPEVG